MRLGQAVLLARVLYLHLLDRRGGRFTLAICRGTQQETAATKDEAKRRYRRTDVYTPNTPPSAAI